MTIYKTIETSANKVINGAVYIGDIYMRTKRPDKIIETSANKVINGAVYIGDIYSRRRR